KQRLAQLQPLLPPVATILSPQEGGAFQAGPVRLKVLLRSPSGAEITGVRVLVNGRVVLGQKGRGVIDLGELGAPETDRALEPGEVLRTVSVPLPEQDCTVA